MAKNLKVVPSSKVKKKQRPASTPEAREQQMISLATELAEEQLRDGTASAQVITHYLKLGSSRDRLEKEKLQEENKLLKAKTEAVKSSKKIEELYEEALSAMKGYRGESEHRDDEL